MAPGEARPGRPDYDQALKRLVPQGRFTALDAELLAAIERADAATLEQVVTHAATESLDEVRSRLGLDRG